MKKHLFLSIVCAIGSITISYSQQKLEIEGKIKIGDDASFPEPGTIRWTGTDFQGWNGTKWVSLTSGIAYAGEVTDIDGNTYPTIVIGLQEWMAENLRTTRYRDGTSIANVTDNTSWFNANYGAWCWYDNDNSYEQPYGKLYNWYAVNDGKGLCPTGWHVPSGDDVSSEWKILIDFLGGLSVAGGPMKEAGTAHWRSPNTGATNSSGFSGLPGGGRSTDGTFNILGFVGYWWSSTESGALAWYRNLDGSNDNAYRYNNDKRLGFSVRCLRD